MGSEDKVPHMRMDVSFPLMMVEFMKGAPDGDGFHYPSHPPVWNLFDHLNIVPVESVLLSSTYSHLPESFSSAGE